MTSHLQEIDFKYNIRGWLTDINDVSNLSPSGQPQDLFAFKLNYDKQDYNYIEAGFKPMYNGNISETQWRTASDNIKRQYNYRYDDLNRLSYAQYIKNYNAATGSFSIANAYDEGLSYDKNGNIERLNRTGQQDLSNNVIGIDELVYTYKPNSNKLLSITDATLNANGFNKQNPTGDDYAYDTNGNLTKDLNKKITSITYNYLNLPSKITMSTGGTIIEYLYTATGVKLQKKVTSAPSGGGSSSYTYTDYLDGFQYEQFSSKSGTQPAKLLFFPTAEGYYNPNINENPYAPAIPAYVYNYTDHLGNVRVSYANVNGETKILEENNYYPFGMKHEGYNNYVNGNTNYKYKFNGKELQTETGNTYDFGARMYMADIGRWGVIDPLAEKYPSYSPYAYALNNPVNYIDTDGRDIVVPNVKDRAAVLKMINAKALGTFAFDKSGKLYQANATGNASKYSKYYADKLVAAINNGKTIEIRVQQTINAPTIVSDGNGGYKIQDNPGTSYDIDKVGGGGLTAARPEVNSNNVLVYISGNENKDLKDTNGKPLEDKPADILVHELVGHAIPSIAGKDTGNSVDNENKVRKEVKTTGQTGESPLRQANLEKE